jgi:hypothetical protein
MVDTEPGEKGLGRLSRVSAEEAAQVNLCDAARPGDTTKTFDFPIVDREVLAALFKRYFGTRKTRPSGVPVKLQALEEQLRKQSPGSDPVGGIHPTGVDDLLDRILRPTRVCKPCRNAGL